MGTKDRARADALAKAVAVNAAHFERWVGIGRHDHQCYVCGVWEQCDDPDCLEADDEMACADCLCEMLRRMS